MVPYLPWLAALLASPAGNSAAGRQVSLLIRRELTDRARDFNVIVDDVSITDLTFGKDYTAAVEAKQVRHRCL